MPQTGKVMVASRNGDVAGIFCGGIVGLVFLEERRGVSATVEFEERVGNAMARAICLKEGPCLPQAADGRYEGSN